MGLFAGRTFLIHMGRHYQIHMLYLTSSLDQVEIIKTHTTENFLKNDRNVGLLILSSLIYLLKYRFIIVVKQTRLALWACRASRLVQLIIRHKQGRHFFLMPDVAYIIFMSISQT